MGPPTLVGGKGGGIRHGNEDDRPVYFRRTGCVPEVQKRQHSLRLVAVDPCDRNQPRPRASADDDLHGDGQPGSIRHSDDREVEGMPGSGRQAFDILPFRDALNHASALHCVGYAQPTEDRGGRVVPLAVSDRRRRPALPAGPKIRHPSCFYLVFALSAQKPKLKGIGEPLWDWLGGNGDQPERRYPRWGRATSEDLDLARQIPTTRSLDGIARKRRAKKSGTTWWGKLDGGAKFGFYHMCPQIPTRRRS